MTDAVVSVSLAGRDVSLSRRAVLLGTLVVNVELAAVVAYFTFTNAAMTSPAFTLYGLVWVNTALVVFAGFDAPDAARSTRRRAAAVAVAYFAVLAAVGGVVGAASANATPSLSVALLPPGWGPALLVTGFGVDAILMPAKVLGYAALALLLYGAVADAAGAGVAGVLGLFSCVSCTLPLVAGAAATLLGGGGALVAATTGFGYGPSTLVFLVTVALLWWRPGAGFFTRG
ncbi:DUF7546 family protein [Halobaculum sp. D14]|uniref:DUF7546 family protein n=1 Tax=Halobaculum sp. D14 TaxID=3421642 RepID=UPI003EB9656A